MIRPNLLNEVAFNYNGNRINMVPSGLWDLTKTQFQQNKIFGFQTNVLPIISLSNQTGANFNNNWNPWINTADSYQIRDDVSWTKGSHQFKMGGSWLNFRKAQPLQVSPEGNFGFNGSFTGYDFADFLLGFAQSYSEAAIEDTRHWNSVSWAAYFQDDWGATRRLTLTSVCDGMESRIPPRLMARWPTGIQTSGMQRGPRRHSRTVGLLREAMVLPMRTGRKSAPALVRPRLPATPIHCAAPAIHSWQLVLIPL